MIVMLSQDLARGFSAWKDMYFENQAKLNALGAKLIFAGSHKDDNNKMMVLIYFSD